jgi:hypothetical protein
LFYICLWTDNDHKLYNGTMFSVFRAHMPKSIGKSQKSISFEIS